MTNPFTNRAAALNGPATDIFPVSPNDGIDLPIVALSLYVEVGGTVSLVTAAGQTRQVVVADTSILPVGALRVRATGTTATGIHALVIA
ncbi:spike base protein, RCAP_Rcc01079 family [Rhodobacter ferrooxidans]|uniref:T9SS type A sorting domain-containing protein n=1 Tax=Rhodobacter ferrooxidans TaxID=371731 RepID=C8RX87_9RHOB|nr:hypothetical protein [Rhodobacter sp. SW2]EEW26612.1 conserved hypothetical protein [Rhodobacter sp. SW2]